MGTIAKLAVVLSANIGGFSSSMAAAAKPVAGFAASVGGAALKIGSLVGAAAGLVSAGSIAVMTAHSMEAIDVNAKLADRLGITTENLVGLQHASNLAGIDAEGLTGSLEKMLKNLSEAAASPGSDNAFAQIGLDARKLVDLSPDEAFKAIADGLSNVQNSAQRASLAQDIFGKSGQKLLPLMLSGAEGIAAAQKEAEKLGLTYSRVDAAKVEAANDSITRLKAVFEGISNQLAIGLAPWIDIAAQKLTELSVTGGGIGPKIGGAIEWVVGGLATSADYVGLLSVAFHGFRAGALQALAGVLGAIDALGGGIVSLINLIPGVNIAWTDTLKNLKTGLEDEAGKEAAAMNKALDAFHRGDNAAAAAKVFDDIRAKAQATAEATAKNGDKMKGAWDDLADSKGLKKIGDTLDSIQKQVDQFGLSDSQKKLGDLIADGASAEQIAQAKGLLDQLDALNDAQKRQQDMESKAKSVIESIQTPLEKYDSQISDLNDLLDASLISWDQYGAAVRKARGELEQTADAKAGGPTAIRAGSAEAQRLAFNSSPGMQRLTRDDVSKKQLDEQKDSNRYLEAIARQTKDLGTGGVTLQEVEI